jgi:hypothetical protein
MMHRKNTPTFMKKQSEFMKMGYRKIRTPNVAGRRLGQ